MGGGVGVPGTVCFLLLRVRSSASRLSSAKPRKKQTRWAHLRGDSKEGEGRRIGTKDVSEEEGNVKFIKSLG